MSIVNQKHSVSRTFSRQASGRNTNDGWFSSNSMRMKQAVRAGSQAVWKVGTQYEMAQMQRIGFCPPDV